LEFVMKSWHAILIAGAMIASAIIIRADINPVTPAWAGQFNANVADCIISAADSGAGFGAGVDLLRSACESKFPN
jgi:hypothetical protein